VLYASASSSAVHQFLCAYTGSALSEFFVLVGELPSFLMLDDLSRHAMAYREIYLLLRIILLVLRIQEKYSLFIRVF